MRKSWKITIPIILVLIILGVLYINNIGYGNLKYMYRLHTTNQSVIFAQNDENGNGQYLTRVNDPVKLLQERLENRGWKFSKQDGAGYFFERDNQEIIITIKKWNHSYYIYKVPNNSIDIEGYPAQKGGAFV
ncbi:hypothetical protein J2TS6_28200 [Paenibacillus albilobatus]|uniref:Uncharacterized protein n=2 Tax=Paenibacillus TaxID=44249 RepID=A0A919XH91_9BACL|nr:hypothetical protein J2TS6_28200 [Paenibacillus albilobatus]